jgi:hypothetical protein
VKEIGGASLPYILTCVVMCVCAHYQIRRLKQTNGGMRMSQHSMPIPTYLMGKFNFYLCVTTSEAHPRQNRELGEKPAPDYTLKSMKDNAREISSRISLS